MKRLTTYLLPFIFALVTLTLAAIAYSSLPRGVPIEDMPPVDARIPQVRHADPASLQAFAIYNGATLNTALENVENGSGSDEQLATLARLLVAQSRLNRVLETNAVFLQSETLGQLQARLDAIANSLQTIRFAGTERTECEEEFNSELTKITSRLSVLRSQVRLRSNVEQSIRNFDSAYARREYQEVRSIGNTLLVDYAGLLRPTEREHVELHRRRAIFREELANLDRRLHDTLQRDQQRGLLAAFIQRYSQVNDLTEEMREAIVERANRLQYVERMLAESKHTEAVDEILKGLRSRNDIGIGDTITEVAEAIRQHPGASPARLAESFCLDRIAAALLAKNAALPQGLEELEFKHSGDGQARLTSGFIKRITTDAGEITGYKIYDSLAAYNNPRAQVGVYPTDSVISGPSRPFPAVCADRYNTAREEFLQKIGRVKSSGEFATLIREFTDVCRNLVEELVEYQAKQGAVASELSFSNDILVLSELAADTVCDAWSQIFGGNSESASTQ